MSAQETSDGMEILDERFPTGTGYEVAYWKLDPEDGLVVKVVRANTGKPPYGFSLEIPSHNACL